MEDEKLKIIQELMQQLQDEMKPSADDFEERLGRKPKVKVVEIESSDKMPMMEMKDKMSGMKGEELGMDEESEEDPYDMGMFSDKDRLKQRLMKLRA